MSDLVERLRHLSEMAAGTHPELDEAADRIEQLEAERDEMFAANGDCANIIGQQEARIEQLEAHKRAQAEDIMTLGQEVGKREARIEQLEARTLSAFSDAEISAEHHSRMTARLGDQSVSVSLPLQEE